MAAFDRVLSGIPEFDTAIDNIRLGDNVVWRVSDLEQFKPVTAMLRISIRIGGLLTEAFP